ncbi:MAG TPA: MFS transporter [Streptosporangiaceae bacterium]
MRHDSRWVTFTLVAAAQFMVVLDTAIINVALPVIKARLGFSETSIQWAVTAYVLAFGGFLLFGGRTADLFGRRRVLLAGMAAFTLFSLLAGLSNSAALLIVLRGLQGASAAFMSPAALSTVLVTFAGDEHQRRRALGFWSMTATGGAAVGLLLGGILTQYAGWRWNFFINVPVGIATGTLIMRLVPRHGAAGDDRQLDLPGAVLVTAGLMAAVLACSQAPVWGWGDPRTLGGLAAAVMLIGGFAVNEHKTGRPLIPLRVFRVRNICGANAMMAAVYAGNLAMFFLLTLYLQGIEGYSAIGTGLAFLPFPVILGFTSTRMAGLVARFGFRRFLILGPALIIAGLTWTCFLPVHGGYALHVLPGLLIMPLGYGMTFAPMYAAATTGAEPRLAGITSGLISASQQMGGAVGLAIVSGAAAAITRSLHGTAPAQALTTGYDAGMGVAAGLTLLALLLAVTAIRSPQHSSPGQETPAKTAAPTAALHTQAVTMRRIATMLEAHRESGLS